VAGPDREGMLGVPGGQVWYGRYGEGSETPLLCVHGGPGMPAYYLEPLTGLRGRRPVVLYDQLGCGRSQRPDDPGLWTLTRSLQELDTVAAELGLDRFHLFGHSWGGLLSIAYALDHPGRVASLTCASPLVSVPDWMADARALLAGLPPAIRALISEHEAAGTTGSPGYQHAARFFYHRHFCRLDPWPEAVTRTFSELGEQAYATMWGPSEFTQTGNLTGTDLSGRLRELTVPTLWTCGTHDEAPPDTIRRYAALTPVAQYAEYAGGSHCVHLEQPGRYLTRLAAFLDPACTPPTGGITLRALAHFRW